MKTQKTTRNMKHYFVWILTSLMFIELFGLAPLSLAGSGVWTKKADMPTTRGVLSTAVVNGLIYAIGGTLSFPQAMATVEAYNPATDQWTKKADLPTPRAGLSTAVVNGIIYAIGGIDSHTTLATAVEAYDPATDTWTKKAPLPTPRNSLSTSVVNGRIYAIGGGTSPYPWPSVVPTLEEYNPGTNTWTKKTDMPTARAGLTSSVVDGLIYVLGGTPDTSSQLSTVEVYNPVTDTWTKQADMPTPRNFLSTSVVDGRIYVIGGFSSLVEEYIPKGVTAVSPQGKLATTWGEVKRGR
jgi:N-acetylneuraminic acid mutarotase